MASYEAYAKPCITALLSYKFLPDGWEEKEEGRQLEDSVKKSQATEEEDFCKDFNGNYIYNKWSS